MRNEKPSAFALSLHTAYEAGTRVSSISSDGGSPVEPWPGANSTSWQRFCNHPVSVLEGRGDGISNTPPQAAFKNLRISTAWLKEKDAELEKKYGGNPDELKKIRGMLDLAIRAIVNNDQSVKDVSLQSIDAGSTEVHLHFSDKKQEIESDAEKLVFRFDARKRVTYVCVQDDKNTELVKLDASVIPGHFGVPVSMSMRSASPKLVAQAREFQEAIGTKRPLDEGTATDSKRPRDESGNSPPTDVARSSNAEHSQLNEVQINAHVYGWFKSLKDVWSNLKPNQEMPPPAGNLTEQALKEVLKDNYVLLTGYEKQINGDLASEKLSQAGAALLMKFAKSFAIARMSETEGKNIKKMSDEELETAATAHHGYQYASDIPKANRKKLDRFVVWVKQEKLQQP